MPLVGVIMTEDKFAMVSGWMANGNINEFVKVHWDVNRFKLVSSPFKLLIPSFIVDDYATSAVGRGREWFDPYARPRNDSR